jgi:hypothetical protein
MVDILGVDLVFLYGGDLPCWQEVRRCWYHHSLFGTRTGDHSAAVVGLRRDCSLPLGIARQHPG